MQIEVRGNLPQQHIQQALTKSTQLLNPPKNTTIFAFSHTKYCKDVLQSISKEDQTNFQILCKTHTTSFTYTYRNKTYILLYLDPQNKRLLKNTTALTGLLLHEIMHAKQQRTKLYENIKKNYKKIYKKNYGFLKGLPYNKKMREQLFTALGNVSILLLKDLYANASLIKLQLGKYLLAYYDETFKHKRTCPRPVFYDKFKQAAKKNTNIIITALTFEFSLLSIILPMQRYNTPKARTLIKHIERCYEVNIQELARKCHELTDFYLQECSTSNTFQQKFFAIIFLKVYYLLLD